MASAACSWDALHAEGFTLSVRGKSALSTIPLGARRQFILDHELGETCEPTLAVHGPRVGLVLQPSSGGSGGSSAKIGAQVQRRFVISRMSI